MLLADEIHHGSAERIRGVLNPREFSRLRTFLGLFWMSL
ncbi:hypothetical protein TC41_2966 [Alicyclobacillus acidocaldarius subsp. acidocaldarius Tc-4-1]|uniref:Uncharacterized protein n=1 Tax=Alicyclobacillus acidocaldarius (strain Tc-4-1) TaxID=1048834 RepID=F8IKT9_ALIAT|nr:hypothetical protein TC41_2966 [Alicyclobacillus acidocaldarius subsp. acidocaldarius Tc-4-1]